MKKTVLYLSVLASFLASKPFVQACEYWGSIDYLYWHTTQSNMTYAVVVSDIAAFANQTAQVQETEWSSGFRLGATYVSSCCWDVHASWTRFHNDVSGSTHQAIIVATQLLAPNVGFIIGGDGIGGPASSRWFLDFDMFDLDFGFDMYQNSLVCLHPYIGLKAGVIDQNEIIDYDDFINTDTEDVVNATTNQRNDFSAVGPKAGFYALFKLPYSLSLIGNFSAATLFGRHFSKASTNIDMAGVASSSSFKTERHKLIPTVQFFIGLGWNTCFCDCYRVCLKAGYETNYFWNIWRTQNSTIQNFFISNAGFGDLMFHGLTARLIVGF